MSTSLSKKSSFKVIFKNFLFNLEKLQEPDGCNSLGFNENENKLIPSSQEDKLCS